MITGEELRLLRQLYCMKQQQMAKALHITQQRYSVLENRDGLLPADKAEKVLAALKLSREDARRFLNNIIPPPPIKFYNNETMGENSYRPYSSYAVALYYPWAA
jgi:transcriptional regulator with XRE-family HTH domain